MDVTRFGRRLRGGRDLHIGRASLNRIAGCRFHGVITLVGGEQTGPRTNLNVLQICWLFDFARRILPGGRIHNVNPNRQSQFTPERATIDLLRFVKACPNCAGKIGIVSGEKGIGEIVGRASFATGRHFL